MTGRLNNGRAARTMLEQKIWDRGETLAEFAEYAERFARQVGERGTLSERNLKRLVAGRKPDGTRIGQPRPATARLLEYIFATEIEDLLSPPKPTTADRAQESEHELRRMLHTSRRIDPMILSLLHRQLDEIRRLDRQLGALVAQEDVNSKIAQVTDLLTYSLTPGIRQRLASIRAELGTLAGWQNLDLGNLAISWRQYENAKAAARESGRHDFKAHTTAEQAFVLVDLGETSTAVDLLSTARKDAERITSRLLRAWLAAAHGEALAADGQHRASLRAFDRAAQLLPEGPDTGDGPYIVLDDVHLARWRGHALARLGRPEALEILLDALGKFDRTFTRAETGMRVDLATAFIAQNEPEQAKDQLANARSLADGIGSVRQQRRIAQLIAQSQ